VAGNTREGRTIDFHVIQVERHFLDSKGIQQHAGLAMMLGGNETLSRVMGGDVEATKLFIVERVFVCNHCWLDKFETLSHRDESLGEVVFRFGGEPDAKGSGVPE
jgi:hypothetical protein